MEDERPVSEIGSAVGYTAVVAVPTAALQMIMKGQSRPNPPNRNTALGVDDGMFWSDWVLAGGWALTTACWAASRTNKAIPSDQIFWAFGSIIIGAIALPFLLRAVAYDPSTGALRRI
jgi:hypothetical protein